MERNISENKSRKKLKVYVLTMREIFCRCMIKANAIDLDGNTLEGRGQILVDEMIKQFGKNYPVLNDGNRPGYYNDKITEIYNQINAGRLTEINSYHSNITEPLVDYAGYKNKLSELNRFFRNVNISTIPPEKLLSYKPLLKAGEIAFAPAEKIISEAPAPTDAARKGGANLNITRQPKPLPASINILYTANPFGLLRYPAEGRLTLTTDQKYEFMPVSQNSINPGIISNAEVTRDENSDDTWIKITYSNNGQPAVIYIAEFADPGETDEFYTLIYPLGLIAALVQAVPAQLK